MVQGGGMWAGGNNSRMVVPSVSIIVMLKDLGPGMISMVFKGY